MMMKIRIPRTTMLAILPLSLLMSPAQSKAELIRPDSHSGRLLVREVTEKVSRSFVLETERLSGAPDAGDSECEVTRTSALEELSRLESQGHHLLNDARSALEKTICATGKPDGSDVPYASGGAGSAQNQFFSATLALRNFETSINR